jgi:nicotinamide-nucleotide amidase
MVDDQRGISLSLLLTGNEILSGNTIDTNSVFLAKALAEAGLEICRKVVVGDDLEMIVKGLQALSQESDVVIVNGGLGSTVDDLTAQAAAEAAGLKLQLHPDAMRHLENRIGQPNWSGYPSYLGQIHKQAKVPVSALLLDNPVGLALGFSITIGRAICYFTPGVPRELEAMFTESILPDILRRFRPAEPIDSARYNITGIGESQIQNMILQRLPAEIWQDIQLGFKAGQSTVEVKLKPIRTGSNPHLREIETMMNDLFREYLIDIDSTLFQAVANRLQERALKLATAESCTGGLLAANIAEIPGVSAVFEAGLVTYSNESKSRLLGIPSAAIERHGAVSREAAVLMVQGVLNVTGADCAVGITGIAGPDGGTATKPVGTVYIGWGDRSTIDCRCLLIRRDRRQFQQLTTAAAADLLRRYLYGYATDQRYYFDELSRS